MESTKRYEAIEKRSINRDVITQEWPEIGFMAENSPFDPVSQIRIEAGKITEMDGKKREEFDFLDAFIADYGINPDVSEEAMALSAVEFAKMLVDVNVPREEILRLAQGLTPARLAEICHLMNAVEIMMAQMKMRARKTPANQAHVTNLKDNPVLLASDAAEAALRGFSEIETTCVVGRNAPFNAIALLIGSQTGRPGVITQCSMEEAFELKLGMLGLTSYAETISVYGTEGVFTDGDDTPWSKAFLASAYASRGIKMRSTSGSGAEVLMGDAEGKSMLYLEARCIWITKACGMQGTQNGAIDGIALSSALPGGLKTIACESLIASVLGLEVASGNDTWFTDSDMRKTTKLLMQLLPGTDLICSGYSAVPNYDNVFSGSNEDCDDYNDFYMIQRDMRVDGGLLPVREEEVIAVRFRAAKALQAVFSELGFAEIREEEVLAAVYAYSSKDIVDRNPQNDIRGAARVLAENISGVKITAALAKRGFETEAEAILNLLKQRVAGDYLQTSAIFDENFKVLSAVNDRNDYCGPGTGYAVSSQRFAKMNDAAHLTSLKEIIEGAGGCQDGQEIRIREGKEAIAGESLAEVVVIVSPSFGESQRQTLSGVAHSTVLREIAAGLEEEGISARFVKCYESSDLGVIGSVGSKLSGSGISIGLQARGTALIHQKDLSPLFNLELFSQSPLYQASTYRQIGKAAGKYAKGQLPSPQPAQIDARTRRFLAKSAILHYCDTQCVVRKKAPMEFVVEG